jgi:putative transposase
VTDSAHDGPIFPTLARELILQKPDQLWAADIISIATGAGFVHLGMILDAWWRPGVGYALGRAVDARLTVAALRAAIEHRRPAPGLVHHSDRAANMLRSSTGSCSPSRASGAR